jgi:tetratricopeptide (TPR) repeat protein
MSKKRPPRRRAKKGKPKKKATAMPDPRSMEKTMAELGRLLSEQEFESTDEVNAFLQGVMAAGEPPPTSQARTPLEEAQDLMYDAWDTPSRKKRIELARKALTISEDCADAYVLMAEESTRSLKRAKSLYEDGVKAGERALGPEAFAEYDGHFWGVMETRPYMRARAGLASCLWQLGEQEPAIRHYQEMLRLNPGDNQGIRYILLLRLFEAGFDDEIAQLLAAYEEDVAANWIYTRALFLFHREGNSQNATAVLREAIEYNPYVPAYLLGRKRLPRSLPPYIGFGDENEAVSYVAEASHLWLREQGATDWLRQVSAESQA